MFSQQLSLSHFVSRYFLGRGGVHMSVELKYCNQEERRSGSYRGNRDEPSFLSLTFRWATMLRHMVSEQLPRKTEQERKQTYLAARSETFLPYFKRLYLDQSYFLIMYGNVMSRKLHSEKNLPASRANSYGALRAQSYVLRIHSSLLLVI